MNDTIDRRKVEEVWDRIDAALTGDDLKGLWSQMDDASDPWGDAVIIWFAVNDLLYANGWETEPSYSPGLGGPDFDSWPTSELRDYVDAGTVTEDDLVTANRVFGAAAHAFELMGLDY